MKKYLVVLAAMVMVIAMVSGATAATKTLAVGASATVATTCNVTGGTLAFGSVNADNAADYTVTASGISIKCTTGTVVAVTDDDGLNVNKMKDGTNFLSYSTIYTTPLTGGGAGAAGTELATALDFQGTVTVAAISGVPAGTYNDTITLTLTY